QARPATEGGGGRGGRGGAAGGANGSAAAPEAPPKPVRIDFDRIQQRILALPLPARNYLGLTTGRAGILFLLEPGNSGGRGGFGGAATLNRFDLKTRKSEKLADNVASFDLSANGDKMLLRLAAAGAGAGRGGRGGATQPPQYVIVSSSTPMKPGEGALRVAD